MRKSNSLNGGIYYWDWVFPPGLPSNYKITCIKRYRKGCNKGKVKHARVKHCLNRGDYESFSFTEW